MRGSRSQVPVAEKVKGKFITFCYSAAASEFSTAVLANVASGASLQIADAQSLMEAVTATLGEPVTYLATAAAVLFIHLIWRIMIGLAIHFVSSRIPILVGEPVRLTL